jgi:hypothetical protein
MKQHDDSSKGSYKSGGRRIDDHSFWAGKPGKDSRFPDGPYKTKEERSARDDAASVDPYEDTTEQIRMQQEMAAKKVKGHMRDHLHRN